MGARSGTLPPRPAVSEGDGRRERPAGRKRAALGTPTPPPRRGAGGQRPTEDAAARSLRRHPPVRPGHSKMDDPAGASRLAPIPAGCVRSFPPYAALTDDEPPAFVTWNTWSACASSSLSCETIMICS